MQAATNENRLMNTTCRYDVLNQQPLMAKAIEGGEAYVALRNGVRHELKSCGGGWILERTHESSGKNLGYDEFFASLAEVQKTVGAFAALPVLVKLGVFNRTLANQRHNF